MNSRIAHVAFNTFREAVRDRVLYNLVFFALLMMAAAIVVGDLPYTAEFQQLSTELIVRESVAAPRTPKRS